MKSEFVAFFFFLNWKICQQTLNLLFSIAIIGWLHEVATLAFHYAYLSAGLLHSP